MNETEKARRVEAAMTSVRDSATHRADEIGVPWEDLPAALAESGVDEFLYRLLAIDPGTNVRPDPEVLALTVGDLARCRDLIDDDGDWT